MTTNEAISLYLQNWQSKFHMHISSSTVMVKVLLYKFSDLSCLLLHGLGTTCQMSGKSIEQ